MAKITPMDSKVLETPSAIPRVMCPRCGTSLRLAEIDPADRGGMVLRFECTCGFDYRMSNTARGEHSL